MIKECRKCGVQFDGWKNQVFCTKECRESYYFNEYRLAKGIEVGVGSGGKMGEANQNYKHGLGIVVNGHNRLMKRSIRYCENCREDLKYADRYSWCVHHRDHNRKNNDRSNLQLLCKVCHQIHHRVWENFEGATTIP